MREYSGFNNKGISGVVRKYVDFLDDDRPLYKDNNRMVELLKSDEVIEAVENELGTELN